MAILRCDHLWLAATRPLSRRGPGDGVTTECRYTLHRMACTPAVKEALAMRSAAASTRSSRLPDNELYDRGCGVRSRFRSEGRSSAAAVEVNRHEGNRLEGRIASRVRPVPRARVSAAPRVPRHRRVAR